MRTLCIIKLREYPKLPLEPTSFWKPLSSLRHCGCGNSMLDVRTGLCCCKRVSYESKPLPTGPSTMHTKCRTRQSLSRPIPKRKRDPICKREDLPGTVLVCHRHWLKGARRVLSFTRPLHLTRINKLPREKHTSPGTETPRQRWAYSTV